MKPLTIREDLRNLAIIAHVDHGKTTLVDALLKQSRVFAAHEQVGELIMDSNDLEREKGITILSKNTSIRYRGVKFNIIDTPGHADFGGEVERVLGMADGCLVLVDAVEGPMPQTRVVLRQAIALNLRLIFVVNKIDRSNANPLHVVEQIHELLLDLAGDAAQLDSPTLFCNAKEGTASTSLDIPSDSLEPLLETVLNYIPPPKVDADGDFQMMVSSLGHDSYRGQLAIGRIQRGVVKVGDSLVICAAQTSRPIKIAGLLTVEALQQLPAETAIAGEIVAVVGLAGVKIGDTLASATNPQALQRSEVGEPTLDMMFSVNASPLSGREATTSSTSRQLRARLDRELLTNVALRVRDGLTAESFQVSGRGELHLAILIETMRREGYEFEVGRPQAVTKMIDGIKSEPVEECTVVTGSDYVGAVTEALGSRGSQLQSMETLEDGSARLIYRSPTRALIGVRGAMLTLTRGTGVMSSRLVDWEAWRPLPRSTRSGVLTASQSGTAVAYGLLGLQDRGIPLIGPGTPVYEGMIVGVNSKPDDIAVNICKEKQKTNIRSSTEDATVKLVPWRELSLEAALDFLADDELLEITPKSLRIRKRVLRSVDRNKIKRREKAG